jgi:hypothetical protein
MECRRNTISFIKGVFTRIAKEPFIFDKALVRFEFASNAALTVI